MHWDADAAFGELAEALSRRPARPLDMPGVELRESAVLVPFFLQEEVPTLLFTRRRDTLRHHAGQISFPGGARDPQDGTALFTALRETHEELGMPPSGVQVLGALDEIPTPSGFRIAPFAGRLPAGVALTPNTTEVEALIEVALPRFFAPGQPRVEKRQVWGRGRDVYFYDVGDHVIWGATAHILRSVLAEVAALPSWKGWTTP